MKFVVRYVFALSIFVLSSTAFSQTDRDRGIDLYQEGKFKEAIELLETSVTADATDRAAWIYLAGAYVHIGEPSKATNAFAKTNVRPTGAQPKYDKSVRITYQP